MHKNKEDHDESTLSATIKRSIEQNKKNSLPFSFYYEISENEFLEPNDFYNHLKESSIHPSRYLFFLWCQERLESKDCIHKIMEEYGSESSKEKAEIMEAIKDFTTTRVSELVKENELSKHDLYWLMYEEFFMTNGFRNIKRIMKYEEEKGYLNKEPLVEYFSSYIPDSKKNVLVALIDRFSEGDYVSFMHIFGHVVEMMLFENDRKYGTESMSNKRLTIGNYIYKSKFYGMDEKDFLLFVLSKEKGLGLRNKYVHYRNEKLEYSKELCWLVLYLLMWLTKERSEKHVETYDTIAPGTVNVTYWEETNT